MAATQAQMKKQKAKKRKRNASNSSTRKATPCLINGNTHTANLKEGKKKQKMGDNTEINVEDIKAEPRSEMIENKMGKKKTGKKKQGDVESNVKIEPEGENKETNIGEKEMGIKMEIASPVNTQKMMGQKKGGGWKMKRMNAEENIEEKIIEGNSSQEVKKENKEEGKKRGGNMTEEEKKEGNKEEGKKIGGNVSQGEEKKENDVTEGKKKRNRKKKKKAAGNITTTTTNTLPSLEQKRKMGQETESNNKEETIDNNASPAKKMKVEAAKSAKGRTGKKNKKKGKGNQGGNAAMNKSKDEGKEMDESKEKNLSENDGKKVGSKGEGKNENTKENDEEKIAMNNMNKPAPGKTTKAKTNQENVPNKPQGNAGNFDITAKKNTEEKMDETGNEGEEKKGMKRRKRTGKEIPAKKMKRDNEEEKEEEKKKVPAKKKKKKNQNMKEKGNKETKNDDNIEKENENETPTKKIKTDNAEIKTDAETDQENSQQPVHSANYRRKKRNKQRKALKKQLARDRMSSPQTGTPPSTNTQTKTDAKTDQEDSTQPVLPAKKKKKLKKKQRKTPQKQDAKVTMSSPQTGTPPSANTQRKTDAKTDQENSTQPVLPAKKKKKQRKTPQKQDAKVTMSSPQTSTALPSSSTDKGAVVPLLHSSCSSDSSKEKIKIAWQDGPGAHKESVIVNEGDVEVIRSPFLAGFIQNLLESEQFLEGVKKELDNIPLLLKNNDLYKFKQTPDLKDVTTPYISALRDFLYKDMRVWLQDITGLPLQDTVDMGCSQYSHTDVLLCHDDVLEGRLIAYILYLVPPWCSKDGGTLDLFSCDDNGHPKDIVRSLVPKNNAFAFFQVCPESFHQVSEVRSRNKTRLSINGWFHGPSVTQQKEKPLPPLPLRSPGQFEEEDFYHWINPKYLDMETQKEIRKKFCDKSELELQFFLTDEAYELLVLSLLDTTGWKQVGPPNLHRYEVLEPDAVPQRARECQQFLQSEAFFLVLSQLTGLRLHRMAPQDSDDDSDDDESPAEPNPRCRVELQRWGHKCYSLLRDDCVDQHSALNAYMFVSTSHKWKQEMGGYITYIAKDEDEELLTVMPRHNCLSLVYCDSQTLRFTKYINSACLSQGPPNVHYHNFSCVYYE